MQAGSSILDKPLDLAAFFQHPVVDTPVSYQGTLYNSSDGRYIQWQFLHKSIESTEVVVKYLENHKTKVADFVLSFSNTEFGRPTLRSLAPGTYQLQLSAGSSGKGTSDQTDTAIAASLLITRSRNFALNDELLHLWTGEIDNLRGGRCQFIILNDTEDPKPISDELFIFNAFLTEQKVWDDSCYNRYLSTCRDHHQFPKFTAEKEFHHFGLTFRFVCAGGCAP